MTTESPDGLWLCTDVEDVLAIQINAVSVSPMGDRKQNLRQAREFLEAFPFVLVVGADPSRRSALAEDLREAVPSVEICITDQSVYKGCSSVAELKTLYGLGAVDELGIYAEELAPWGILEASSVEKVDIANQPHVRSGIPSLDRLVGGLYGGELTVWTGKRKEGKSTMIGLPVLAAIKAGHKVCVYSGELPAWRYKAWLLAMAAGPDNLVMEQTDTDKEVWVPRPEIGGQIDLWWKGKLFFVDNNVEGIHKPENLLAIFSHCQKRYGCDVFVVDNLMTTELPGDDFYRAQSAFVGQLIDFAHQTGGHVHLVAHKRKSNNGNGRGQKSDSDDVAGSSDITNRADNTFCVTREERTEENPFDACLEVVNNRDFGNTGKIYLNFEPKSRRYYESNPNWHCGWEQQPKQNTIIELVNDPEMPF